MKYRWIGLIAFIAATQVIAGLEKLTNFSINEVLMQQIPGLTAFNDSVIAEKEYQATVQARQQESFRNMENQAAETSYKLFKQQRNKDPQGTHAMLLEAAIKKQELMKQAYANNPGLRDRVRELDRQADQVIEQKRHDPADPEGKFKEYLYR